jgi:hypothetical protein
METCSFQVRIHLADTVAGLACQDPTNPMLESLTTVLARHNASMKCQLDAFMDYVIEAETQGFEHYPLSQWTKETIDDPAKSQKHLGVFTLYVDGEEVYPKKVADALEYDLSASVDGTLIKRIAKYDRTPQTTPSRRRSKLGTVRRLETQYPVRLRPTATGPLHVILGRARRRYTKM